MESETQDKRYTGRENGPARGLMFTLTHIVLTENQIQSLSCMVLSVGLCSPLVDALALLSIVLTHPLQYLDLPYV